MDDEQAGQEVAGNRDWLAVRLALGVAVVSAFVVLLALHPLLVNLYGPFSEHSRLGLLAALAVALVVGVAVGLVGRSMARHSIPALVVLVAGLVALAVVAFPVQVDRHESFVERPNERSSCAGVTFRHYPPGTSDAASVTYCVGLEQPRPAG